MAWRHLGKIGNSLLFAIGGYSITFFLILDFVNSSTGYRTDRPEFEHIDFYHAPVDKNNIPVRLALLGGWVSLNT